MTHYLVVAHETADRPDLARALARVAADDPAAVFTLLVTATASMRGMTGHTTAFERLAHDAAERARQELRGAGIHLVRVLAGDGSPSIAVEDELRLHQQMYDAVVLCTRAPGLRSWLAGDIRTQIEAAAGLPVLHLHARSTDTWRRAPAPRSVRWSRWWALTRFAPAEQDPTGSVPTRRQLLPVLALMLLYLTAGLALAITVNRGFLLNDAVAILLYSSVVGGLLFLLRSES